MTKKIWDLYAINSAKIFSQCRPMLVGTGGLTLFPGTPLLEESERGNDPQGRGYGSVFGDIRGKMMKYEKGFVFDLMEQCGPNDVREPYFKRFFEVKRIHWRDRWS